MPFKHRSRPGVWRGQVKWQGRTYQATFPTRREAAEWEVARRRELEESQARMSNATDLVGFFVQYLKEAELRFTKRTFEEKRSLCHRFLEMFGNVDVSDLTPDMVRKYLNHQAEDRSMNCFNRDRKNLLAMWNWGVDFLELESNPVSKIKPLHHDRAPQYVPTTEEVLRILAVATRAERVVLACYLQTAARRSEVFRWTWAEDVNFDRREVRLGTRKTRGGSLEHEWLPMSEELYEELWWWWNHRPIKSAPYVFVCSQPGRHYGKPYTTRRRFMKGLCERAGVRPFGFHSLRRYVASVLADTHKVSAKTIQRILRHKNVSTTERYIQKINADLTATMELLKTKRLSSGLSKDGNSVENKT